MSLMSDKSLKNEFITNIRCVLSVFDNLVKNLYKCDKSIYRKVNPLICDYFLEKNNVYENIECQYNECITNIENVDSKDISKICMSKYS